MWFLQFFLNIPVHRLHIINTRYKFKNNISIESIFETFDIECLQGFITLKRA